jgi:hypothetical protein
VAAVVVAEEPLAGMRRLRLALPARPRVGTPQAAAVLPALVPAVEDSAEAVAEACS